MSIIPKLASSAGHHEQALNIRLAEEIVQMHDRQAIKDLVDNLSNKNRAVQGDCIKVLYEAGERDPSLLAPHTNIFLKLLHSKNNRLQWGAMTALHAIAKVQPEEIHAALPQIMDAAGKGSVITRDNAVFILIQLCGIPAYRANAFALLADQLKSCPPMQLAMYAERSLPVVDAAHAPAIAGILQKRMPDLEKESQRRRLEKLLKKLSAK